MSRYIDADKQKNLIDNCADLGGKFGEIITLIKGYAKDMVDATPTADVRENVMGEWRTTYLDHVAMGERPNILYCSVCNQCIAYPTNYCPNCGADMRPREMGEHADITIIEESVCADRRCES